MSSSVVMGASLASGSVTENKTVPMNQMKKNVVSNATYISELFKTAQL
jgi:hypothetical protein